LLALVGALFAPPDPLRISRQTDKLFARILGVIRDNFADPDFGPVQAAAKAAISLRYLHKLFTEGGFYLTHPAGAPAFIHVDLITLRILWVVERH
jgi:hypothetical protein